MGSSITRFCATVEEELEVDDEVVVVVSLDDDDVEEVEDEGPVRVTK